MFFYQENPVRFFIFHLFQSFIIHLSGVFSLFTFLECFHFSPFSAAFIFDISRAFHFSPFSGVFLLLYRECYEFEEVFFFLLSGVFYFTPLPHICRSTASATDLREFFLLSSIFYLTVLPGSSSLKVAGPPTEVRNTDLGHLFVWITQC